jgi:hypothetical protein
VVFDNLNNGVTGCTNTHGTGYTRYLTGLPVPSLQRGSTYPIAVTVGPGGTEHVRIFIDWNQDGDWLDAGEDTYIGSGNNVTINGNITVPNDAFFGQTVCAFVLSSTPLYSLHAPAIPLAKQRTIW